MTTLHLTNGDCALAPLQRAGLRGTFLPWRDILHEGPVPAGLDLEALSSVRSRFLAGLGSKTESEIRSELAARDQVLLAANGFREIFLWFEDDLYDQLQILQILASFPADAPTTWLVEVEGRLGADVESLDRALARRRRVDDSIFDLARMAWAAFRATTPEPWAALRNRDLSQLPSLRPAVLRWLEELPDVRTGLPRVECRALEILSRGARTGEELFSRYGATEERPFLGDSVFYDRLRALLAPPHPLVEISGAEAADLPFPEQPIHLAPSGQEVLEGRRRWTELRPPDRWFGGTHLRPDSLWFWDAETRELRRG